MSPGGQFFSVVILDTRTIKIRVLRCNFDCQVNIAHRSTAGFSMLPKRTTLVTLPRKYGSLVDLLTRPGIAATPFVPLHA